MDALTQLKALGPLGIAPVLAADVSNPDQLQQEGDPFASALVQQAFTDAPVALLGKLNSPKNFFGFVG